MFSKKALLLPMLVVLGSAVGLAFQDTEQEVLVIPSEEAAAQLLERVEPTYPPIAKATGIGGAVKLEIEISEAGAVQNTRVISGHPLLVQAALEAVQQWKYRPIVKNGVARRVRTSVDVSFDLPGADEMARAGNNYFHSFDKAQQAYDRKDYPAAEKHILEALQWAEKLPSERYMERQTAMQLLAYTYLNERKAKEAQALFEKRVELLEKNQKPDEAELAGAVMDLAFLHKLTGDYAKAEPLYRRAISALEIRLTDNSPFLEAAIAGNARKLVVSLDSLGVIYLSWGRAEEADTLFSRAIEVADQRLKEKDLLRISLENKLLALQTMGKKEEADSVRKRLQMLDDGPP